MLIKIICGVIIWTATWFVLFKLIDNTTINESHYSDSLFFCD